MFKISLFKRGFVFTDSIFYSHFILAVIFLISQVTRMWESTQGISSSNYLMNLSYVLIITFLIVKSRRENIEKGNSTRILNQMLFNFIFGIICYSILAGISLFRPIENVFWDTNDTLTTLIVLSGIVCLFVISYYKQISIWGPVFKGLFGICLKSLPQLFWAYKVYEHGIGGLDPIMILTFNLMTSIRITQTAIELKRNPGDKKRKGILISEIPNLGSFLLVTLAWAFHKGFLN